VDGVNSEAIKALVLAAGEGSRLRKYAKQKTLHHIAGVPLLGRILQGLKEAGINSVYIDITYITAQNWEKGNLYSFLAAKGVFKTNFILCMGDHIFDIQIVKNLINVNLNAALVLAVDRVGYASDDTKVREHDGMILNIGKHINPSNCVDTGFFLCSPKIFSYAERTAKQGASELADCIRLSAQNKDAQVLDVSGHYWVGRRHQKRPRTCKKITG
jgi:choline kinase